MSIRHGYATTRLGELLLVAEDDALTGVYFPGHTYPPDADMIGERVPVDTGEIDTGVSDDVSSDVGVGAHSHSDAGSPAARDPLLAQAADELRQYLAGARQEFDVPISTAGDPLSEEVWQRLLEIPYGETTTYGAIAAALGRRELAQRVGQCVGHNPISIIIPCHRVLGADGSLTGYAGGLDRKRALLDLEEPEEAKLSRLF